MYKRIPERMVTVRLYGHLRKFGKEFSVSVRSTKEAIHALSVMVPGFKDYLNKADKLGMEFAVFNGKRNIGADELELGAKDIIKIAPVYGGRKSAGGLQTIIGAILIAVAIVYSGGSAAGAFSASGLAGGAVATMGAAMVIGGIVSMVTATNLSLSTDSDSDNSASYAFGGPVNTTAQGNPIPIFYGYREVGGAVLAAGMYSVDIS